MSRYAYSLKPFGSSQKDFYGKANGSGLVTGTTSKQPSNFTSVKR